MIWYHNAPQNSCVWQSDPTKTIQTSYHIGPFNTLREARDDAIVHFQWEKKCIEDKIKELRAIDLRCQPRGAK